MSPRPTAIPYTNTALTHLSLYQRLKDKILPSKMAFLMSKRVEWYDVYGTMTPPVVRDIMQKIKE